MVRTEGPGNPTGLRCRADGAQPRLVKCLQAIENTTRYEFQIRNGEINDLCRREDLRENRSAPGFGFQLMGNCVSATGGEASA